MRGLVTLMHTHKADSRQEVEEEVKEEEVELKEIGERRMGRFWRDESERIMAIIIL